MALVLGILVLSLLVALFYIFIYRGAATTGKPGPLLVNATKIDNIPQEVNQGDVVVFRVSLKSNYKENEYRDNTVDCTGDLDLHKVCVFGPEVENKTCLSLKIDNGKTGRVEKTIRLKPGEEKELNYTLHIPDYGREIDFDDTITGPLMIKCSGSCVMFRVPECLPYGYVHYGYSPAIWINTTIRRGN